MRTLFTRLRIPFALLSAALVFAPRASVAQSALRFSLPFGPHVVGYRSVILYDQSRNVPKDTVDESGAPVTAPRPRPVHLSIWYPARPSNTGPMKYRDYLALYGSSLKVPATTDAGRRAAEESLTRWTNLLIRSPGVSIAARSDSLRAAIRREGALPTHARLNAIPDGHAYPIAIYGAGAEGPSFENDVLMEYLASYGYLAVGVPSWTETGGPILDNAPSLETAARDMELALRYARERPGEATERVALMGWSWGGFASVVVASRNQSVAAVVGLDASVRYYWHDPSLRDKVENSYSFATPSLFINQGGTPLSTIAQIGGDTTFAFYDSLRYADKYRVTLRDMRHQNFAAMYNRLAGPQPSFFVSDPKVASAGYMTIAKYIVTFLDAYLKRDASSRRLLEQARTQLGLPDTNVTMDHRLARRPVPTMAAFRQALGPGGWAGAPGVLERLQRSDSDYTLHRDSLESTGSAFLDDDRVAEGVGAYRVYVKLFPKAPRSWNGLADAYAAAHDTANAVASYQEALKLVPTNARAMAGLKRLGKTPP